MNICSDLTSIEAVTKELINIFMTGRFVVCICLGDYKNGDAQPEMVTVLCKSNTRSKCLVMLCSWRCVVVRNMHVTCMI